jgi:hypothetical protein
MSGEPKTPQPTKSEISDLEPTADPKGGELTKVTSVGPMKGPLASVTDIIIDPFDPNR